MLVECVYSYFGDIYDAGLKKNKWVEFCPLTQFNICDCEELKSVSVLSGEYKGNSFALTEEQFNYSIKKGKLRIIK